MNNSIEALFDAHLPSKSVDYCLDLHQRMPFEFKIRKKRNTKHGDYRYDPSRKSHRITVNDNLPPQGFLFTLIHEIAHLKTRLENKRWASPHGKQWKDNFRLLLEPLLLSSIFTDGQLKILRIHMLNPRASSSADPRLFKELYVLDLSEEDSVMVEELSIGACFIYQGKRFKLIKHRRTRSLCLEVDTSKRYLFFKALFVEEIG